MSNADEGIKTIIKEFDNSWKTKDNESMIRYMLKLIKCRIMIETLKKEFNKHITGVDTFLADRILEDDPTYQIIVDGINFKPIIKESYSLDKDLLKEEEQIWDSEKFFKFLEENGEGGVIKVKKTVHHKTRDKILDELRNQNIDLPEFIKVNFFKCMKYSETAVKKLVS